MAEDGGEGDLAPVIPLFGTGAGAGARANDASERAADGSGVRGGGGSGSPGGDRWHTTWTEPSAAGRVTAGEDTDEDADAIELAQAAEAVLLRRLRTRSLSVREARACLTERGLDVASADAVVERFIGNGYLDDAALAEQIVHTAVSRKGQGRFAAAQTLSGRGIPRETIDAALADLPGDEWERALEFARTKARAMRGLDREVALRRLSGQLARRGYGAQSLDAARRALGELSDLGAASRRRVQFEP